MELKEIKKRFSVLFGIFFEVLPDYTKLSHGQKAEILKKTWCQIGDMKESHEFWSAVCREDAQNGSENGRAIVRYKNLRIEVEKLIKENIHSQYKAKK